jgi:hypothetical protein
MSPMLALLLALAAGEGRPMFYWGARPPVVAADPRADAPEVARVLEVHAALDAGSLVLRFTFDRRVKDAMYLPDGRPVSGRLRAVLYVDSDDDRATGLDRGPRDLRTGAERRIEVGVTSVGEDPDERRKAQALVTASLVSLRRDGAERGLWRGDDDTADQVSAHGEWVEVRVPAERVGIGARGRLVLAVDNQSWEGRFPPVTQEK